MLMPTNSWRLLQRVKTTPLISTPASSMSSGRMPGMAGTTARALPLAPASTITQLSSP